MARLQGYDAQVRPDTAQTPRMPGQWGQYAGGMAEIGQGLQRAAGSVNQMSQIAQEFQNADDHSNWLKMQADMTEWRSNYDQELSQKPDIDMEEVKRQYQKKEDALFSQYGQKMSPRNRDNYRQLIKSDFARHRVGVLNLKRQKTVDNNLMAVNMAIDKRFQADMATGRVDFASMEQYINSTIDGITIGKETEDGTHANVLSEPDAYQLKQQLTAKYQTAYAKAAEERGKQHVQQMLVGMAASTGQDGKPIGWDGVNDFLSKPENVKRLMDENGVEVRDINSFMISLERFSRGEKAKQEKAVYNTREAISTDVVEMIRSGNFSEAEKLIKNGQNGIELTSEKKEHYYTVMDNAIKAQGEDKDSPFEKDDPAVEADVFAMIHAGAIEDVWQIEKFRGNGLSNSTTEKAISTFKTSDTPKNRWRNAITTTGSTYLNNLKSVGLFGEKDTPEAAELMAAKQLQWQAWREEHPDANQEEAQAYLREITREERKEKITQFFRNDTAFYDEESQRDTQILNQLSAREKQAADRRKYVVEQDQKAGKYPFKNGEQVIKNGVTYTWNAETQLWEFE